MATESRGCVVARLYTTPGGWGLPTIDADGLSAHALLRFCDISYAAVPTLATPGDPPVIVIERAPASCSPPETAHGLSGLIGLLTSDPSLPDPSPHLTPVMAAESTAFATLVSSRFSPALQFEFYLKQSNYNDVWHRVLSKTEPFPLNRIVPYMARRIAWTAFEGRRKSPAELYFDAGIALAALSTRLGDQKKFFYGDRPSVLDAIVFGQLIAVLCAPLPDPQLKSMVVSHNNLVQFVKRIKCNFFPEGPGEGWGADLDAEAVAEMKREGAARRAAEQRRRADSEAAAARENERRRAEAKEGSQDVEEDEEARRSRYNQYFIYGSMAVFAAHLLFGSEIELEVGSS